MQAFKFVRNVVVTCATLIAITSPALKASAQTAPAAGVKTVLLVHGAWADGSSWSKLIPLLEAKGLPCDCCPDPAHLIRRRRCSNPAGHRSRGWALIARRSLVRRGCYHRSWNDPKVGRTRLCVGSSSRSGRVGFWSHYKRSNTCRLRTTPRQEWLPQTGLPRGLLRISRRIFPPKKLPF